MSDSLDVLIAKQEITEVLHKYCESADLGDPALAEEVWHPDAVVHYEGAFDGTARDFAEWVRERRTTNRAMAHYVTNTIIAVSGDKATSRSYIIGYVQNAESTHNLTSGRASDTWVRLDGKWLITERHFARDVYLSIPGAQSHG